VRLEVDPVRLRAPRSRLDLPVETAAQRAGLDVATIERLETTTEAIELGVLRRLATRRSSAARRYR
jgi:hypothetical protein